jgi:hypothetical protein
MTSMRMLRLQPLREAGGWRRFFVAGSLLLAIASFAWAWHVQQEGTSDGDYIEFALTLWSLGAAALALLAIGLSLLDSTCVWVGRGFGLAPATTRFGLVAVLAGLTFAGTAAAWLRYETVMPEGRGLRTGELCVVLDRWTGEAKPCTDEAVARRHRRFLEPRRTQEERSDEALWQQVIGGIVTELMNATSWLPGMARPAIFL